MKEQPKRFLEIAPWSVVEKGFHRDRSRVSESIFSLANEFMGIRGHFDEGYGGDSLIGSYFNGVFVEHPHIYPLRLRGFPERNHFMVNAVNWLYTRLSLEGELLDLRRAKVSDFERSLDLRTGTMTRSFIWEARKGRRLRLKFVRFLSMVRPQLGCQRLELEPLNFSGSISIVLGMDFSPPHETAGRNFWACPRKGKQGNLRAILGEAEGSGQKIFSAFRYESSVRPSATTEIKNEEKLAGVTLRFNLKRGTTLRIDRLAAHYVEKNRAVSVKKVWENGVKKSAKLLATAFEKEHAGQREYWAKVWRHFDISIEGDPPNEQGTRYCIYQLLSTFHGVDPRLNIGAKGLTGEVYGGLAFWDTETYCLPFYIFTDPPAARNLLLFRYNTLPQARERARQLDCEGARYPMTTIDGTETCGVWHHGDLEIHVPAAVAYGVWQYVHITGDTRFLYNYGLEMLIEISRFYATHGDWSPRTGEFGLWGVMGADEFHMMIHNNAYTNTMAKKTFEWTLEGIKQMKKAKPAEFSRLSKRLGLRTEEPRAWAKMAREMRLQRGAKNGLIEQHDGYFDLPHVDLAALSSRKKPICKNYPYIKRSRHDWIKQPDVLLLPFFFSHDYSLREKRINFDYYEPRCAHESSLSPGIHSILAAELGKHEMAFAYVKYASRMDLDDYNGNTREGLHMTSMAAAWLSLAYGFGGMRSDGPLLSFNPSIPAKWKSFTFRLTYRKSLIEVHINRERAKFHLLKGPAVEFRVYGIKRKLNARGVSVALPRANVAA